MSINLDYGRRVVDRSSIRAKFRAENPEITDRVVSDSTLNSWMATCNEEVCGETRCITSEDSFVINSVINIQRYDLESTISNFLDIDDNPGGGVYYDNVPLSKSSPGGENYRNKRWKTSDSGIPKRYWRRGKFLWLNCPASESGIEIAIDCILTPNVLDSDDEEPFNGIQHLQVFCDVINKYLQWRCKAKVGKSEEASTAYRDYLTYLAWMKKKVKGGKYGAIYLKSSDK